MKILICGKSGSGKSTITALLAKSLKNKGYRVLAVDADESNQGLHVQLGLKAPECLMDQKSGKKARFKMPSTRTESEKATILIEDWSIDDIPTNYVSKKDKLHLLQIGNHKHSREGYACPMGGLLQDFIKYLRLQPNDIALIDTEADVEHLGRDIDGSVDIVLTVLDPSYESFLLYRKISASAMEGDKKVYFILNKADDSLAEKIAPKVSKKKVIGVIPFSDTIQEKGPNVEVLDIDLPQIAEITSFVIQKLTGI